MVLCLLPPTHEAGINYVQDTLRFTVRDEPAHYRWSYKIDFTLYFSAHEKRRDENEADGWLSIRAIPDVSFLLLDAVGDTVLSTHLDDNGELFFTDTMHPEIMKAFCSLRIVAGPRV